ncbi:hypothetical protein J3R30DRAFT_1795172 [Lentinula aciculospora]|uniref:Arrestin C-terminal-like domain-containing protein n=1 Tax=Lentinula aciculospora TaxID=153920 RepID=A0A9W9AIJ4_9AGAR|nr:hypothetical protein J3R30DRAFT_1795172 [Lentinula aciculospora]
MQVTHEIIVISGPSEDDGTAGGSGGDDGTNAPGGGGGGENVVVERIWDGGVAAVGGAGPTSNRGPGVAPPLNPVPQLPLMPPLPTPPLTNQNSSNNLNSARVTGRAIRPLPPPPPTASPIPPPPTSFSFLNLDSSISTPTVPSPPHISGVSFIPSSTTLTHALPSMFPSIPHPTSPSLFALNPPLAPHPLSSSSLSEHAGGSGSLHYLITISGRSFPIGGTIPIEITLMPLEKVRVHRVSVVIEQKIEYYTQFKRVERTDPILTVPLLSVKHDSPSASSKDKDKELKHILPLESDDPEALKNSPLYGVMRKTLMRNMRRGESDFEDFEDFEDIAEFEPSESEETTSSGVESEADSDSESSSESGSDMDDDLNDLATSESSESNGFNDCSPRTRPRRSRQHYSKHSYKRNKPKPAALSSLASSLMGPGPWSISLALPLPLAHASNLTPKQVKEYEEKMEEYQQQHGQAQHGFGGFGGAGGYSKRDSIGKSDSSGARRVEKEWEKKQDNKNNKKEKKPELVDVGRGLLPSNKNKRSNVTISHLLKCVIRVERGELEEDADEEKQEESVFGEELRLRSPPSQIQPSRFGTASGAGSASGSALADADRSGWDDEWEYVQSNKEIRQDRESRERKVRVQEPPKPFRQKPKKKRKLFDIVVQTPIQIHSVSVSGTFSTNLCFMFYFYNLYPFSVDATQNSLLFQDIPLHPDILILRILLISIRLRLYLLLHPLLPASTFHLCLQRQAQDLQL